MLLQYVKEMPKVGTKLKFDLSSLLSALFFTWIIELLFPVSARYDLFLRKEVKMDQILSQFAGHINISRVREATEAENYDENAWSEGWSLLANLLCLLLCPVGYLHDTVCDFWLLDR